MGTIIFFIIIGGIATLMGIRLYIQDKKTYQSLPEVDEDPSKIVELDLNGHTMYLAPSEMDMWNKLSNRQKMQVHLTQREKIRTGEILKVEGGLITKNEALLKGILIKYQDPKTGKDKIVKREEAIKIGIITK